VLGCKSDENNQFCRLKFGILGLVHQFAAAVALRFAAENGSALVKALDRRARVEVKGR
jgi:hypothetical protein